MSQASKETGLLHEIGRLMQHEGDKVRQLDIDGNVAMSSYQQMSAGFQIQDSEWFALTNREWLAKLQPMCTEVARQQLKRMFEVVNDAAKATGNVAKMKNNQISADDILDMLDRMPMDFEAGRPKEGLQIVANSEKARQDLEFLKTSIEFQQGYHELVSRKFLEWRLREADRRLAQ